MIGCCPNEGSVTIFGGPADTARIDPFFSTGGVAACLFAALVGAASAQTGQTIELTDVPAPGSNLDMATSGAQVLREELGGGPNDLGSECQAMLQQLDAMKNQPLRRDALWQRYQAECQSGLDGAPVYSPPLPQ